MRETGYIFCSGLTPARHVPHSLPSYFFAIYREIATKFQSHLLMYGHVCRLTARRRETGREGKSHFHACSSLPLFLCPFLSFFRSGGQPQWDGALIQCRTSFSRTPRGFLMLHPQHFLDCLQKSAVCVLPCLQTGSPPKYGGK